MEDTALLHHVGEDSRFYHLDPHSQHSTTLKQWCYSSKVPDFPAFLFIPTTVILLTDGQLMIVSVAKHMNGELRFKGFVKLESSTWNNAHGMLFFLSDHTSIVVKQ